MVIDCQSGQPLDLLPGRDSQALSGWLIDHRGIEASALVAGPDRAGMPGSGACMGSLSSGEISEEVEDERVGLVRCFQRDEMRGARDFDVTGVR